MKLIDRLFQSKTDSVPESSGRKQLWYINDTSQGFAPNNTKLTSFTVIKRPQLTAIDAWAESFKQLYSTYKA